MSLANITAATTKAPAAGDINADTHIAIMCFYFYFLWPSLIALGIVNNFLSIIVFLAMGPRDSVSISFLALSVADLFYLMLSSVVAVTAAIGIQPWQSTLTVHVYFLGGVASWYEGLFMETAMGITGYIGIARCCCVAIALKFRNTFTVSRTLVTMGLILFVAVITRVPLLRTTGLYWYTNPATNVTRLLAYFNEDFDARKEVYDIINRTIFPNVLLLIVFSCSIILTRTLVNAARTRRLMTGRANRATASLKDRTVKSDPSLNDTQKGLYAGEQRIGEKLSDRSKGQVLNGKEIQVVKQVTAVAGFLLLAVLVQSINSIAQVVEPEFMSGRRYKRLYNVTVGFGSSCCHLNACVNFFIYLRFNRRFRQVFDRLFTCSGNVQK